MRDKPTRSSLNLTETACKALCGRGGVRTWYWFRVFVGEEQWFTNGHVLMNQAPPFKGVEAFIGPLDRKVNTDSTIADLESGQRYKVEIGPVFQGRQDNILVPLLNSESELVPSMKPVAHLQEKYASLMRWTYPDCTFHVLDSISVVEVRDTEHNLVALVMPCRM